MSDQQAQVDTGPAEIYEQFLVPAMFGPWAKDLVDLAAPQPGERVLDVACGTGVVARLAAERVTSVGKVVGLDFDPPMLKVARSLPLGSGAAIVWQDGNALDMAFADRTFDLVLCQQGIQFFPDPVAGLKEMCRVLRSEGRLVAAVWRSIEHCPGHAALSQAMARHVSTAATKLPPFSLGDPEELCGLVRAAGFHDVKIRSVVKVSRFPSAEKFVEWVTTGASVATRRALAQVGDHARRTFINDVSLALSKFMDKEGLAIPMESHLLAARAQ